MNGIFGVELSYAPSGACLDFLDFTHGLRRGLYPFAATRLEFGKCRAKSLCRDYANVQLGQRDPVKLRAGLGDEPKVRSTG